MIIRAGVPQHAHEVQHICLSAFNPDEKDVVARLAVDILGLCTPSVTTKNPPGCRAQAVSFIAYAQKKPIGFIGCTPLKLTADSHIRAFNLSPLAVLPAFQHRGIGGELVHHLLAYLSKHGATHLTVYGDPQYYTRFGFRADIGRYFEPPFTLAHPQAWMALALCDEAALKEPMPFETVPALNHQEFW